jgi:hypothetical protein
MGAKMKKIALFVEGQTEQIFTEKLIREFIGKHGFSVTNYKILGGKKSPRKPLCLTAQNIGVGTEYYFVIYDCGGDNKVQSDIRERIDSLRKQSFSLVIGIRDVYPCLETDIVNIRRYLYYGISPMSGVSIEIILAVMEIESWFLAEETHYPKIYKKLSLEVANKIAKMDVSTSDTETIPHPSDILKQIYMKGGRTYNKSREKVQRTVDALDYENLYINIRNRNKSLNELLTCLDGLIP